MGVSGKHTPGPWFYRPHAPYDWGWVTDAAGDFITQAKDPRARDEATLDAHRAAQTDPWEATARLIAAAPDMFEVLSGILDGVEDEADPSDGVDGVVLLPLYESEIRAARAALAKATGEQSQ